MTATARYWRASKLQTTSPLSLVGAAGIFVSRIGGIMPQDTKWAWVSFATRIAKRLNILDKADRIALFQVDFRARITLVS